MATKYSLRVRWPVVLHFESYCRSRSILLRPLQYVRRIQQLARIANRQHRRTDFMAARERVDQVVIQLPIVDGERALERLLDEQAASRLRIVLPLALPRVYRRCACGRRAVQTQMVGIDEANFAVRS